MPKKGTLLVFAPKPNGVVTQLTKAAEKAGYSVKHCQSVTCLEGALSFTDDVAGVIAIGVEIPTMCRTFCLNAMELPKQALVQLSDTASKRDAHKALESLL